MTYFQRTSAVGDKVAFGALQTPTVYGKLRAVSIWVHGDVAEDAKLAVTPGEPCRFCGSTMRHITSSSGEVGPWHQHDVVLACDQCGWHMVWRSETGTIGPKRIENTRYWTAAASLANLDLSDIATPIEDVRAYLVAKSEARFEVHPRVMEETVASVFSSQGWTASVTAYSNDGGIDVILDRGNEKVAVQVKRYRGRIEVEQVRALVGALQDNRITTGIFVTTSKFTKGAVDYSERSSSKPYGIELIDGEGFLQELQIQQRGAYGDLSEVPAALAGRLELRETYVDTNSGLMAKYRTDDYQP